MTTATAAAVKVVFECEGCGRKSPCCHTVDSRHGETTQCCQCRHDVACDECDTPYTEAA